MTAKLDGRELARVKWRASGITDAQAKRLRFELMDAAACERAGFAAVPALRIPYFTPDGKPTKFYRVRYLTKPPGFAGALKKPQRYAQPKGSFNEVYLPPLLEKPWTTVLKDVNTPLVVTEGELKSAAACAAGLACLGLGGVDVWRSAKHAAPLLPVLELFEWTGRRVSIIYDSDAATNDNVVRAQNQLAKALVELGAFPTIVSLPGGHDGQKQGLDDYLIAHGAEALEELIDEAPGLDEALSLWALNDEVVYIEDPGFIVRRDTGQIIYPTSFIQHAYSHRSYEEITQSGDDAPKRKKKPLAPRWIQWPGRFALRNLVYAPAQPAITHDRSWNTWKGWGVAPEPGDVKPWHDLMRYVFGDDHAARVWFERWCAYPLQHPGVKMFTSAVIWSAAQGTGKTLIGYTLRDIYGVNAVEIKGADLTKTFNAWARYRQFVIGDEVTGSDKRHEADQLKGLITQEQVKVNEKFIPEFVIKDCINYYFTSNQPDAFFLDDTDRRFFVWEIVGAPAPPVFYRRYDAWLKREHGPAHLFDYLLKLDLGDFDPRGHALSTTSKEIMIEMSKSDLGTWVNTLLKDPDRVLLPLGADVGTKAALFTTTQLFQAYDPMHSTRATISSMGRELKRAGFKQVNKGRSIRLDSGGQRLWAVRDVEKWDKAGPAAIADEYNSWFGVNSKRKY
jgi:hypothetical protein